MAHVSLADPVCGVLRGVLTEAYATSGFADIRLHPEGTYVCIEGPAFSTRAESHWYRSMGAAVIGMTNMPEARLAREAEIAHATLALANLQGNALRAQTLLAHAVRLIAAHWPCSPGHTALAAGLVTPPAVMSAAVRQRLASLIARLV